MLASTSTRRALSRLAGSHGASVTAIPQIFPRTETVIPPTVTMKELRQRRARAIPDDYVLPWPSSAPATRARPGVSADYMIGVHPAAHPARPRRRVDADYDFPAELLSVLPPRPVVRAANLAPPTGAQAEGAWPVSPPVAASCVDADYVYEWPSSLAVRAPRSRITDESYVYEWPSAAPMLSKPSPTHVMNWRG
mmetsp:Transcript_6388/g.16346  ORF Transcript_6388/g.16346 Transcript_6388/m.16346 type:complete len:194 (-) Transcript_6388:274-855(-)